MFCQKCGKQLMGNEKFCIECGQPTQINRIHEAKAPVRKKTKPISLVLAIAAGIVLTLLTSYFALCGYFLSLNENNIFLDVSYQYMKKYDIGSFPKLSDTKISIKGKEAIVTGKYSKLSGGQTLRVRGIQINPNYTQSGEFIVFYDDIFEYFPDFSVLSDKVTLIDAGSGD